MNLEPISATAPSAWAPYLMNGDSSGLEPDEIAAAESFVRYLGAWPCECEDAGFCWQHDASRFLPLGADCQIYTALVAN